MSGEGVLTRLPRPFIVGVVVEETAPAAAATMAAGARDGADAFELNLPPLARVTPTAVGSLVGGAPGPVYTTCRRSAFMTVYGFDAHDLPDWSDDERMERQLALIPAGAVAVDIELDTFDPSPAPPLGSAAAVRFAATPGEPAELTRSAPAIARQRQVAAEARSLGGEALFSCHTGRPQGVDGLLRIAAAAVDRGADLLKIVTPCLGRDDLYAILEASARVSETVPIPFTILGAGDAGRLTRSIGTAFGAAWSIGRSSGVTHAFVEQPLLTELREVRGILPPAAGPRKGVNGRA